MVHPHIPEINHIYGTIIDGAPRHPRLHTGQLLRVCRPGGRPFPTGSGTGRARGTAFYLRGLLGKDDVLVNESVIGTVFQGRVLQETQVGDFAAVIPEISGTAYIAGFCNWVLDARDPLKTVFLCANASHPTPTPDGAPGAFDLRAPSLLIL